MVILKILYLHFILEDEKVRQSRSDTILADVTAVCAKWFHCYTVCLAPLPNFSMYIHPLSYSLSLCTHGPFLSVFCVYLHLFTLFSLVYFVGWLYSFKCVYMHVATHIFVLIYAYMYMSICKFLSIWNWMYVCGLQWR